MERSRATQPTQQIMSSGQVASCSELWDLCGFFFFQDITMNFPYYTEGSPQLPFVRKVIHDHTVVWDPAVEEGGLAHNHLFAAAYAGRNSILGRKPHPGIPGVTQSKRQVGLLYMEPPWKQCKCAPSSKYFCLTPRSWLQPMDFVKTTYFADSSRKIITLSTQISDVYDVNCTPT